MAVEKDQNSPQKLTLGHLRYYNINCSFPFLVCNLLYNLIGQRDLCPGRSTNENPCSRPRARPTCHQGVFGPAAEPVHGAAGDEGGELEGSRAELLPHRREAQNHVQVLTDPTHEVLVKVLVGGRSPRKLPLHDRNEIAEDFVNLVASKEVGHLHECTRTSSPPVWNWELGTGNWEQCLISSYFYALCSVFRAKLGNRQ